jgi:hypothetical protein
VSFPKKVIDLARLAREHPFAIPQTGIADSAHGILTRIGVAAALLVMKRSLYGKNLRDFGFVRCSDDVSEKLRMAFPGLQSERRWARYRHLVWGKDKEMMIQVMRS